MADSKRFPNGFTSWRETHFEVVSEITRSIKDNKPGLANERAEAQGHGGLYELATELTDEFEKLHQGREWDGDYFDVVEAFFREKNI